MALVKLSKPHSQIDIWSDMPDMAKQLKKAPMRMNSAMAAAMNSSAIPARAEAAKLIGKRIIIKSSDAKKRIRILRASRNNLRVSLKGAGRMLSFFDTNKSPPSQKHDGTAVNKPHGGKRSTIKHAFIATMPGGHKGVFVRRSGKGRARVKPHYAELPIREKLKPSVAHTLTNKDIAPQITGAYRAVFKKRLGQQIARQIRAMERQFKKGRG